ncbi:hypothetical protein B0T11DRAFT_22731 [Plectosphaerella cucumerina]|uniref:Postreplication repair E3 ubiquitin-protein ligase RAD18 n=1 Tax=Plectosphaerella cucumerina TaxID=40658 RepID=A0A8K0XAK1_9PEZI|nr:hypothetical protein B0T11DRAFT_22731 [Plectosphaerella cucumerina]
MTTQDVSDPTDWHGTPLAGFAAVESALRCQMCKDFYKTPMLTTCSHTFCSLCIRRALATDGQCPLCRTKALESQLRNNWALEEAVVAFSEARQAALDYAKRPAAPPPQKSPKRKLRASAEEQQQEPETKRLRSSTRLSRQRAQAPPGPVTAQITGYVSDSQAASDEEGGPWYEEVDRVEDEEEDVYVPEKPEPAEVDLDDGLVSCPMCQARMKEALVFGHLDTCTGPTSSTHNRAPRGQTSKSAPGPARPLGLPIPTPERLPTLNYDMMKDLALRKKMTELGLSALGSRQLLQNRHKEWITIWNANCDSAKPKTRAALLQDLATWERTIGGGNAGPSRGVEVKDKDFNGDAWASKHQSNFRDLVASARRSRAQATEAKQEPKAESPAEAPVAEYDAAQMVSLEPSQGGAPLPSIEGVAGSPGVI